MAKGRRYARDYVSFSDKILFVMLGGFWVGGVVLPFVLWPNIVPGMIFLLVGIVGLVECLRFLRYVKSQQAVRDTVIKDDVSGAIESGDNRNWIVWGVDEVQDTVAD